MPYVGWRIFAYRYYHDRPFLQTPVAKTDLMKTIRDTFQAPEKEGVHDDYLWALALAFINGAGSTKRKA
mgnify:CR=1 FL=1